MKWLPRESFTGAGPQAPPTNLKPTPRHTVPANECRIFLNLCCFFQPHVPLLFFFLLSLLIFLTPLPTSLLLFGFFSTPPHSAARFHSAPPSLPSRVLNLLSSPAPHLPPPPSLLHAVVSFSFLFTSHRPLHLYTNHFCSVVHSVWGWTRTPPWPPVRGERLSGTKTSLAPLSPPKKSLSIFTSLLFLFVPPLFTPNG